MLWCRGGFPFTNAEANEKKEGEGDFLSPPFLCEVLCEVSKVYGAVRMPSAAYNEKQSAPKWWKNGRCNSRNCFFGVNFFLYGIFFYYSASLGSFSLITFTSFSPKRAVLRVQVILLWEIMFKLLLQ